MLWMGEHALNKICLSESCWKLSKFIEIVKVTLRLIVMLVSFINDLLIFSDHSGRRLIQLMYETYNLVQIPTHQYRTESVYVGFVEK